MNVKHVSKVPEEAVAAGKGTTRQVLIGPGEGPNFAMRRFIMQPGGGIPRHSNTVEHEQYVLRGRARVGIGEEVANVTEGDVLFIPAGTPHWYEVEGDQAFEFICVVPNQPDRMELSPGTRRGPSQ
ncbi:MAG TPA: cupin domain-containing protein [Candidatus Eisenbacteria bacterium]|jgi:quercetin dioxygenase-like cupin family protein